MLGRSKYISAAALGATLLAIPMAGSALAHERRTVGPVQMVVGWLNEPAYSEFLNAVQVRLADDAGPISDNGDALKVEVSFGDQKVGPLELRAAFGVPGEYRSELVPNRPGVYSFRFVGSVKGHTIDERFTSSERTFNSVQDTVTVQFPAKDPSVGQLGSRIERLEPRLEGVRTEATSKADDVKATADRALLVGSLGVLIGVVGVVAGKRQRRGKDAPALERTATEATKITSTSTL